MRHDDHLRDDEMLRFVDRHMTRDEHTRAGAHVARCASCAGRRAMFARLSSPGQSDSGGAPGRHAAGRVRLRARLAIEADRNGRRWLPFVSPARWAAAAAVAGVALAAAWLLPLRGVDAPRALASVEPDALPVAAFTPGATVEIEVRDVCAGSLPAQEIDAAVRATVLRRYGMESVPPDEYELDYLITPQLGGAPDPRNLWPQRYRQRVWNAGVKDQLEDLLPRLVCQGAVDLRTAQQDIAVDWVAAYRRYFRTTVPLQPATALAGLSVAAPLFQREALFR